LNTTENVQSKSYGFYRVQSTLFMASRSNNRLHRNIFACVPRDGWAPVIRVSRDSDNLMWIYQRMMTVLNYSTVAKYNVKFRPVGSVSERTIDVVYAKFRCQKFEKLLPSTLYRIKIRHSIRSICMVYICFLGESTHINFG